MQGYYGDLKTTISQRGVKSKLNYLIIQELPFLYIDILM